MEASEAARIAKRNLEVGLRKDAEGSYSYDAIASREAGENASSEIIRDPRIRRPQFLLRDNCEVSPRLR